MIQYQKQERRGEDRIVSISQSHVRPIVCGKVGKSTEFGAKISVSRLAMDLYLSTELAGMRSTRARILKAR